MAYVPPAMRVDCPVCGAPPGSACQTQAGQIAMVTHGLRVDRAARYGITDARGRADLEAGPDPRYLPPAGEAS